LMQRWSAPETPTDALRHTACSGPGRCAKCATRPAGVLIVSRPRQPPSPCPHQNVCPAWACRNARAWSACIGSRAGISDSALPITAVCTRRWSRDTPPPARSVPWASSVLHRRGGQSGGAVGDG
jgi:hypothetical protein